MTDDKKKLSPEELEEVAGGASDNDIEGYLACDDGSEYAPVGEPGEPNGEPFSEPKGEPFGER